jgi:hypothetical protein
MALVSGAACALRFAGFIRSAATAVAGWAASNSARHVGSASLDKAEQQASEGNE